MAKETVQAVREAELNAIQSEEEADQKKDTLLLEAQQNAKALISSKTKEAQKNAEHDIFEATHKGEKMIEAANQSAEKEVLMLKEIAKRKEQEAVDLILSSVI
jgi:V/A-type H+-transporting ATPase subunit G/H